MTNLRLSLVAGYPVEEPSPSDHVTLPSMRGVWKRFVAGIQAARRHRTDSEIGNYIMRNGGVLTDELEREIGRRFGR